MNPLFNGLLVNEEQLPELYLLLKEAAEILDVPLPLLFVENNSGINAWTSGSNLTFLALTSGLVEKFNEEELLAVIGHELGHIKGWHVHYRALAENAHSILEAQAGVASALEYSGVWLASAIGMFQNAKISNTTKELINSLFEWSRAAEFTADRAALLVTQNLDVTINVMAKLSSGLNRRFNPQAFLRQAQAFKKFEHHCADHYRQMVIKQDSHPLVVVRAEELQRWASTAVYKDLTNPSQEGAEIRFACKSCDQEMVANILLSGQEVDCPACASPVRIPGMRLPPPIPTNT